MKGQKHETGEAQCPVNGDSAIIGQQFLQKVKTCCPGVLEEKNHESGKSEELTHEIE